MNITPILNAIIELLAALVMCLLIPWIRAHTTNEQQATVRALIRSGVYAAEQLYQGEGRGADKLEYVVKYLADNGYEVNRAEIEAAVSKYINGPLQMIGVIEPDSVDNSGE